MKIGLYFGSFNPIHIGHLIIASAIKNKTDLQKIWLVVSPHNPLKPSKSLLNEFNRLHLVKLAVEDDENLEVSDIEFKLPRPSYTIDTLTYLKEKYPQHEFSIIMGSDSFQNITKWKNYELLLNNYQVYIYQRPNFPVENPAENITIVNAPLLEISATQVRLLIKNNKSIRYLVPEKVREEIEQNRYYKS
ncbi:nicotinate (nicotinamide) nucleotide adenylyltransferase [Aridibaculum aurantiacum]|uniref:nicotinate (nicotinamide) nucleotide adenylyltransferase n=1 Tax=Aridibaculum aurantiacum TaxID=2810307 RepID=UPI001A979F6C|nr:nicotinate (nicotinamide) nucleotide adenylyltransferase [Aridibaculum aurantiacum]